MLIPQSPHKTRDSFTLIEVTVVVMIMGILAAVAAPAVRDALVQSRGKASSANIRMIEEAKRQFALDHPWLTAAGNTNDLGGYMRYGMPASQHDDSVSTMVDGGEIGGYEYIDVLDLTKVTRSRFNAHPGFEPRGAGNPVQMALNGFNDLGEDVKPVLVASSGGDPVTATVPDGSEALLGLVGALTNSTLTLLNDGMRGGVQAVVTTPRRTNAITGAAGVVAFFFSDDTGGVRSVVSVSRGTTTAAGWLSASLLIASADGDSVRVEAPSGELIRTLSSKALFLGARINRADP